MISFAPLQILILVLLLIWAVNSYRRHKAHNEINLPPGPWKLPLIGNMHQLLGSRVPHRTLSKLAEKHGPLMHLKLGEISTLIVSSPRMACEVMKKQDISFANRPQLLVSKKLLYRGTDILFSPYGEYWREIRKICIQEMLSAKKVKSFSSIRDDEVSNLIESIRRSAGAKLNLSEMVSSLTSSIVSRVVFGGKYADSDAFLSLSKEALSLLTAIHLVDFFPSMKVLCALAGMERKFMKLHNKADKILERIIREHRKKGHIFSESVDTEDLVDVLLRVQQTNELSISDDNVKAVILDMFAAGTDTTSVTIEWAMSELIRNKRMMEKAQAEVRRVLKGKTRISETDMEMLSYLKAVIKETLRFHPPAPLSVPRECAKQCRVGGYNIPLKTRVVVNIWAINRDPEYWDDAECFDPERFISNPAIDFKGNNFEYIPFGAGRRICPGIQFGISNVELPLAQLLYHFDWRLSGGGKSEDLDMAEGFGAAVGRKNCLQVIATPYVPPVD